jgi:hypothetical protein
MIFGVISFEATAWWDSKRGVGNQKTLDVYTRTGLIDQRMIEKPGEFSNLVQQ